MRKSFKQYCEMMSQVGSDEFNRYFNLIIKKIDASNPGTSFRVSNLSPQDFERVMDHVNSYGDYGYYVSWDIPSRTVQVGDPGDI